MNKKSEKGTKELNPVLRIAVVITASLIFAVNINTFVHTGGLLPGGASGVTLLIQQIGIKFFNVKIPYTLVNVLINAFPVYIGFKFIGKKFTALSCVVIVLSSVLTDIIPAYTITKDTLLISIFGGLINGVAISMCLLVDATSGGTDFISIYLSEKNGIDSFNIILGFNAVILTVAGFLFSWDKALYSIIFQYVSTMTIRLLYRKYQQTTLFIVTKEPKKICEIIYDMSHHGATIMEGEGSYEHDEKKIIYSVVSSAEANKVVKAIREYEPDAFVNEFKSERISGRFYRVPKD
ncbi:MAG: YitT family protein [Lachnospiraceae bacterium]|nr:YitT family protein [Lachnospiraceae bacterium]